MAVLQAFSPISSCSSSSASFGKTKASLYKYNPNVSVSKLLNDELIRREGLKTFKTTNPQIGIFNPETENKCLNKKDDISNSMLLKEMYALMDIVADRVEMHNNIGSQRDNWNSLLLNSVNGMTCTAATMAGITGVIGDGGPSFLALKLSSTLLYMAATGVLMVMNKIQPSQLAEEQRNTSRLFKQLHGEMKKKIVLGNGNYSDSDDVKESMEKFLALENLVRKGKRNGWNENLEEEMEEIVGVLKRKDTEEYIKLHKLVLKINKILAICGPLFTGIAAAGSALMGSSSSSFYGSFAAVFSLVFGAMAIVVNSFEHAGQMGMVFEMYRSSAGFFRLMGETIESNLEENEEIERDNGELFEMKVALQLGRSLSELRDLADDDAISHSDDDFASKFF